MALRGPAGYSTTSLLIRHIEGTVSDESPRRHAGGAQARGAPRVVLSTAERNASAQRLFARAGFRRTMIEMTHELDDVAS